MASIMPFHPSSLTGGSSRLDKQAAKLEDCYVVSLDWLLDSEKAKKRLSEKKYLFGPTKDVKDASDADASKNENGSSKKRSLADTFDGDEQLPNKKQRDRQKAKSKDLKVEVDECFRFHNGGGMMGAPLISNRKAD